MTGDPITDCGVPLPLPPTSSTEGLVVYCNSCDGGLAILLAGGGGWGELWGSFSDKKVLPEKGHFSNFYKSNTKQY